jgi:methylmalonyl-CoA mutase
MSSERATDSLQQVQAAAVAGENIFDVLMEACKWCSLGQLTEAMFDVGGAYRRNM